MTFILTHDSVSSPAPASSAAGWRIQPWHAQALLFTVFGLATLAGFLATSPDTAAHAVSRAGGDLTRLLRAMAAIKAAMALGVVAAVGWRLVAPVSPRWLAGYVLSTAAMAVGPGLIWDMARLAVGAAFLHGGLLVAVIMLWRDPEIGRRLATALRRAR